VDLSFDDLKQKFNIQLLENFKILDVILSMIFADGF